MNGDTIFNVLVIGGGINGLCALYHLKRLGVRRVGLVEQFFIGHERGSSHGETRITRSTYRAPEYVHLMKWVQQEEWPKLEKDAGKRLIYPNPGLFIGPPCEHFSRYIHAIEKEDVDVDILSPADVCKLYPQFTFNGVETVLLDKTTGIISVKEVMESLVGLAHENGVQIYENTSVCEIDPLAEPLIIKTNQKILRAERLIVTAGAWAGDLLPFLRPQLQVVRQTVGYFTPESHWDDYRPGRFPVWAYIGKDENHFFYGMPEWNRSGIKVARHLRVGGDNPNDGSGLIEPDKIEELNHFMATFFTSSKWTFAGAEHCLYTNSPSENFIIDRHPENPHIIIGAGFSGHGFKFGPFTGRLLAELAWEGKISIPDVDMVKCLFSLQKNLHKLSL